MATFVISVIVIAAAAYLSHQFYQWIRRAQGTLDDDPYNDHFNFEEWSRAAQKDYDALNADFEATADDFPPIVKYEGAKKTRTRVRKTVTKKAPVKKAPKKGVKKMTPKKVTHG